MDFKRKKVLIFGLGQYPEGSGISAARFFIQHGANVRITDLKTERELKKNVRALKKMRTARGSPRITFILGKHRISDIIWADIIVRNPGVSSNSSYLKSARARGLPIYTDASLFLLLAPCSVIGVTGTRGKSTTTALLGEMLKKKYKKVFVGGNIQRSPLTFLEKLDKNSLAVLELSSWLLESFRDIRRSPGAAIVTNIYPDHLNAHKSMEEYVRAKECIFRFQKKSDILVLNKRNKYTRNMAEKAGPGIRIFWFDPKRPAFWTNNPALSGAHNLENINAAAKLAEALGINRAGILRAIRGFQGLSGRQEIVSRKKSVLWVNDTTATSPEAVIAALSLFSDALAQKALDKKIVLIAGGADKNFTRAQYRKLAAAIQKHCKAAVLLSGTATERLAEFLNSKSLILGSVKNMQSAVRLASKHARSGDIVLLSPGAASFGIFKNEFDRGEQFKRYVNRI